MKLRLLLQRVHSHAAVPGARTSSVNCASTLNQRMHTDRAAVGDVNDVQHAAADVERDDVGAGSGNKRGSVQSYEYEDVLQDFASREFLSSISNRAHTHTHTHNRAHTHIYIIYLKDNPLYLFSEYSTAGCI